MTSSASSNKPKRFYKQAAIEPIEGGWTVALDGRTIKTPARAALTLPTERLARAVAAEWQSQEDYIDLASMHLTRLANVAIDRAEETREDLADELARYCETDLICHIAETPDELAESEESHWAPVRDWAGDTLGVNLVPVIGVVASPQPDASLDAARDHALGLDAFRLTGLLYAAGLFGSALLALAVEQEAMSAEDAFEVSRIDEAYQADHWGEDEEAKEATEARRREAKAIGVWFRALV
jgi:chaperone required for assembly of F1-ATPase